MAYDFYKPQQLRSDAGIKHQLVHVARQSELCWAATLIVRSQPTIQPAATRRNDQESIENNRVRSLRPAGYFMYTGLKVLRHLGGRFDWINT